MTIPFSFNIPFRILSTYWQFKDNKLLVNSDKDTPGRSPFALWVDISGKTSKPAVVCLYDGSFAQETQSDTSKNDDDIVKEAMKYFAVH